MPRGIRRYLAKITATADTNEAVTIRFCRSGSDGAFSTSAKPSSTASTGHTRRGRNAPSGNSATPAVSNQAAATAIAYQPGLPSTRRSALEPRGKPTVKAISTNASAARAPADRAAA